MVLHAQALADPLERFVRSYHEDGTGCWIWTGQRNPAGYGRFFADRRYHAAHRWIYERMVGPIPGRLVLDHFVCNRGADGCVNPDHCRPTSRSDNSSRNAQSRRTQCPRGHPYDDENTIHRPDGGRACRACGREARRRWSSANRGKINEARRVRRANGAME